MRPGSERGRPAGAASAVSTSIKTGSTVPQQLARRRDAALRLPPLLDGLRDPYLKGLQAACRPALVVEDPASGTILVCGPGVTDVLFAGGGRPRWSEPANGYVLPLDSLDQVVEGLHFVGYDVQVVTR